MNQMRRVAIVGDDGRYAAFAELDLDTHRASGLLETRRCLACDVADRDLAGVQFYRAREIEEARHDRKRLPDLVIDDP